MFTWFGLPPKWTEFGKEKCREGAPWKQRIKRRWHSRVRRPPTLLRRRSFPFFLFLCCCTIQKSQHTHRTQIRRNGCKWLVVTRSNYSKFWKLLPMAVSPYSHCFCSLFSSIWEFRFAATTMRVFRGPIGSTLFTPPGSFQRARLEQWWPLFDVVLFVFRHFIQAL